MAGEVVDNQGRGEADWQWPSVHQEGRKFAIVSGVLALAFLLVLDWEIIGWLFLALTGGILAFFRDPERVVPQSEKSILSPADGVVCQTVEIDPPAELVGDDNTGDIGLPAGPVTRISIFMSVFDVHINRSPIGGIVRRLIYMPGQFISADLDKASEENERQHILVERADGVLIGFTQIAGLVARRIVPFVKPGDMIAPGQRVGLIRFGSRVDVYLPVGTTPRVLLGQKMVAGETILAELGEQLLIEGVSQ